MSKHTLNINGQMQAVDVAPDTPLLWALRDSLNLVGTKYGCGVGQCGSCTVQINGVPTRSCMVPVSALGKQKVTTIEGLDAKAMHPLQTAWQELDVPQCGYCQAGQIMTAAALLKDKPHPTDADIDAAAGERTASETSCRPPCTCCRTKPVSSPAKPSKSAAATRSQSDR